jgi:hypothetical protein
MAADKRSLGFNIAFAGLAALWLGAAWGVAQALLRG